MQLEAIQDKKLIMTKQVQLQAKGRRGLTHSQKVDFTQPRRFGIGLDRIRVFVGYCPLRVGERYAMEALIPF